MEFKAASEKRGGLGEVECLEFVGVTFKQPPMA